MWLPDPSTKVECQRRRRDVTQCLRGTAGLRIEREKEFLWQPVGHQFFYVSVNYQKHIFFGYRTLQFPSPLPWSPSSNTSSITSGRSLFQCEGRNAFNSVLLWPCWPVVKLPDSTEWMATAKGIKLIIIVASNWWTVWLPQPRVIPLFWEKES